MKIDERIITAAGAPIELQKQGELIFKSDNRFHPDVEMWRDAYMKEYHSHMLTFKVLRQAEYDLDCAKKEIENLREFLKKIERENTDVN